MNLRPSDPSAKILPFFLNYKNGKCTKQCIGVHKFGNVAKNVAKYLDLPIPDEYTGHCFRRSSATMLADAGADMLALKRLGGWKSSSVAEGYVDNSLKNQVDNSIKISQAVETMPSTSNYLINNTTDRNINVSYNTDNNSNTVSVRPTFTFNNYNNKNI